MATVNKAFRVKNGLIVEGQPTDVVVGQDTLPEVIQDVVGAMVDTNIESGISVSYDDVNGKLDFNVNDPTITLTGDVTGSATMTNLGNVSIEASIAANSVALGTDTTGDYVASVSEGSGIALQGTTTGEGASFIINNSDPGSAQPIFKNVAVSGQDTIVASTNNDTLTVAGGTGITVTTDAVNDTVTITNNGILSISGTTNEIETSGNAGTITIGLPDDVTITNDLNVGGDTVITGNLTVNGTTTTLNSETLAIEDNIVVLNGNVTGVPTLDAGIEVERGFYANAKIYWNETANAWYVSTPADDATTLVDAEIATGGNLTMFANVSDGTNTATADSSSDTINFAAGNGLTVLVDAATDTVTYTPDSTVAVVTPTLILPDSRIGTFTTTLADNSQTNIDTWKSIEYSSAKYLVQMKNVSGDIHFLEVLVAVDASPNAYVVEYGEVFSNVALGETDAVVDPTGDVHLTVTGSAGVTVKVQRTLIEV